MSAALETFLARLYSDSAFRDAFCADAPAALATAPLADEEKHALLKIDKLGLKLAAASYEKKREGRGR
jgi:hypothetical protein